MRKLLIFLAFVLGITGLMAWIITSSTEIDRLELDPDYEDLGL